MIHKGIVAYTAEEHQGEVIINRYFADRVEEIETDQWDELVDFLTQDKGDALHICWSLYQFSDVIFSLLPLNRQREINDKPRTFYNDTKIFYVDRVLGLTLNRPAKGNIYEYGETNFYDLYRWLPTDKPPESAQELEQWGYQVLEALSQLNIYPDRLTSPVSILTDTIDTSKLPTIWSCNENLIDAMLYADNMAGYEWRTVYKKTDDGNWFDLNSAYPSFIAELPNTDHCKVYHSDKPLKADFGIMKGKVTSTVKVTPLNLSVPYFTLDEIRWLYNHDAGTFKMDDGYFIMFENGDKPYKDIVNKLLELKSSGEPLVKHLAKQMSVGISGKLDQTNKDGSMGDLYNPILAAIVRSKCRLAVADFIYSHNLQDDLISVLVDGVRATKNIDLPDKVKPGEWRGESKEVMPATN